MVRWGGIVFLAGALAGNVAITRVAVAQCRGGGTQATTGAAGITAAAGLVGSGGLAGGAGLLTSPGSLAYDMLVQQVVAQQIAQRQMLLVMQQQQLRQEKLTARRYRAEQTRTQVAESRARTRAALAAQSGLQSKQAPVSLVAYRSPR